MSDNKEQFLMISYPILADTAYSLPEKAVYSYLKGWENAFPGVDKIATTLGLSAATVKRCTESLVKAGKLIKKRRFGNSNIYICADWFSKDIQLAQIEPIDNIRTAQIDTIEQLKLSHRSAQIDTMNSSNCDTIILDIKSSIKSDSLDQLKDNGIESDKEELENMTPPLEITSTVSDLPTVSNTVPRDKYYISPEKERAFFEGMNKIKESINEFNYTDEDEVPF